MLSANDAQRFRTGTLALPGPLTGIKSRSSTANGGSRRFTPYDGVTDNVDVPGAAGGPRGRQSVYRGGVQTVITQPPSQTNPTFAQIESQWAGLPQQAFGGNPTQQMQLMQAILSTQGLTMSALGGNRFAQPDMTSEVPSENGISSYAGFGGPPGYFPKYNGTPGAEPSAWGLYAQARPSALITDLPSPNPGANGGGSDGFFQSTREGVASSLTRNPFETINWQQAADTRVQGVIESPVNAPMVYAIMAALSPDEERRGLAAQFEETQEGQVVYQAVEDLGVLRQSLHDFDGELSPEKLPHSIFNVVSANWFLATSETAAPPLMGWKLCDVLGRLQPHGLVRGDSSARFGPNERFELSRRVMNCTVGGGTEFVFNEWGNVRLGQEVWHIIKRVPITKIRAVPHERPGSFSLTGSSEQIHVVPDSKTRNPFQIVPWIGESLHAKPTRKDVAYYDDDGLIWHGAAIKIGVVVQIDFPSPLKILTDHSSYNNHVRAQLPIIGVMYEGRLYQV